MISVCWLSLVQHYGWYLDVGVLLFKLVSIWRWRHNMEPKYKPYDKSHLWLRTLSLWNWEGQHNMRSLGWPHVPQYWCVWKRQLTHPLWQASMTCSSSLLPHPDSLSQFHFNICNEHSCMSRYFHPDLLCKATWDWDKATHFRATWMCTFWGSDNFCSYLMWCELLLRAPIPFTLFGTHELWLHSYWFHLR